MSHERTSPHCPGGVWFGIGFRSSHVLRLAGAGEMECSLLCCEDFDQSIRIGVHGWRLGGRATFCIDAVLLLVTSLRDPDALNGHMIGWIDVEESLGTRWAPVSRVISRLEPMIRTRRADRRAGQQPIRVSEWVKLRDGVVRAAETIGMELDAAAPQVRAIAIPGAGLRIETSLACGVGTVLLRGPKEQGSSREAAAS